MAPDNHQELAERPMLFISHKHSDAPIADALQKFLTQHAGAKIDVFQSSSAGVRHPRPGESLAGALKRSLWRAGVVVLIFTGGPQDWSYCLWECGVASHPANTRILVFQVGDEAPPVYAENVGIHVQDRISLQKFVRDFLTEPDFFPDFNEAVAPGLASDGEQIRTATQELSRVLKEVMPKEAAVELDFAYIPFMRIQLTLEQVGVIGGLDPLDGALAVLDAATVTDIDEGAKRLFGRSSVDKSVPFRNLVDDWRQRRPRSSIRWVDEIAEQIRLGCRDQIPNVTWQILESVDTTDRARYAPILSRVRNVPLEDLRQFNIYFSKFEADETGAIKIGFETQESQPTIPTVAMDAEREVPPVSAPVSGNSVEVGDWDGRFDSSVERDSSLFALVLEVLQATEKGQGYRTVRGIAHQSGLAEAEVEKAVASNPRLIQRSSIPNRQGEALFRLRRG